MKAAAMQSISTSETLEIISMDFLHVDKSSGGYQEIMNKQPIYLMLTNGRNRRQKYLKSRIDNRHNAKSLRSSILLPGDRVLVQNMSERGGKGK